jgi:hypothetical protein
MAGTVQTFLKVLIGANTKGFKKDMDEGEKAVKHFAGETKGALDKFAEVFGVNLDETRKKAKSFGDGLSAIGKGFRSSAAGSEGFSFALKALKTALAATGVGVLLIALASVATYFTKTEVGARKLASGMAQFKAVAEVATQRFAKLGDSLLWLLQGNGVMALSSFKEAFTGIGEEARGAAASAKTLAQNIYDLTYREMNFMVVKSEQVALLEEERLLSRDLDLTAKQRLDHLMKAAAIEKKVDEEELAIAAEKIVNAQLALQTETQNIDKKKALAEAYAAYNNILAESFAFERSLARQKNTLIKEIKAQFEEQKKLNEVTRLYIAPPKVNNTNGSEIDPNALRPDLIPELSAVSSELQNMYSITEQSIENVAIGFGEWMGAFSAGLAGFRGARQLVGNAFGDMLIQLGQVAVKTGIGMEVIKKAFQSLSGVAAIGIGVGLIAFGSAIKGSIQSIGDARSAATDGGGYGSSLTAGGSLTYGNSSNLVQNKLQLDGTVILKLSGPDLIALLNSENTRIQITT